MKILLVACLFFGAAICSPMQMDADAIVDRFLQSGTYIRQLNPSRSPGLKYASGEMRAERLVKTGPNFITYEDPDRYGLDLHLGASQATFTLKGIEMDGRTFDGVIEVSSLSAHVRFVLHFIRCQVHVDVDFEPVDFVLHSTTLPEFVGRSVTKAFMNSLNAEVDDYRKQLDYFANVMCQIM